MFPICHCSSLQISSWIVPNPNLVVNRLGGNPDSKPALPACSNVVAKCLRFAGSLVLASIANQIGCHVVIANIANQIGCHVALFQVRDVVKR